MDPEFSKGGFSLGKQLERRKVWPKGRQGATVFLTDRAAGAEEEARSRDGGRGDFSGQGGSAVSWGHCA